jgi:hypothetical protein
MSITVMKQELEALEEFGNHRHDCPQWPTYTEPEKYPACDCGYDKAITTGRQAIAEAEKREAYQEPVADRLDRLLWEFVDLQAKFPEHKPKPETWPHVMAYAPKVEQDPVAWSVEGWSDNTLYARSIFHKLEESKNTAAAFAKHYPTVHTIPLYTHPQPKIEWVGLTDEELKPICDENYIAYGAYTVDFIKAIEAKLKEKNT